MPSLLGEKALAICSVQLPVVSQFTTAMFFVTVSMPQARLTMAVTVKLPGNVNR